MDQKLLNALNNLSDSLSEIGDILKDKKSDKSATTAALQSGDFSKDLKEISLGIQSIKKDTQEILNQQKTILELSKSKESDKEVSVFEKVGGDKKTESNLKKGVGSILLIAVAVLAIGTAFKMIGGIDFISVVGLSLSLLIISAAFEKIGKSLEGMSLRDVFKVSLTMVVISSALVASSYILSGIKQIGLLQIATGILIASMFVVLSSKLQPLFSAVSSFKESGVKSKDLLFTMVAISAGIVASSWILSGIKPVGLFQMVTGIMIAGMFAVISFNIDKLARGVATFKRYKVTKTDLLLTLTAISAAITASSWILSLMKPLSFSQLVTGVLIATMFAVVSFNIEKIALGVVAFQKTKVKATDLLLTLVAISGAITVSSWILSLIVPLDFSKFLTALGVAILFALMSYVMPQMALGVAIIAKTLGEKKLWLIPVVFIAIATAITLSSWILSTAKPMDFMFLLKLLALGVILAAVTLAMMPSILLVGIAASSGVGTVAILLGVALIPVIALALATSSHILAMGKYDKYPGLEWALGVGGSIVGFSATAVILGAIAMTGLGAIAIGLGAGMILIIAESIVQTDKIISKGKYDKYPGLEWALSVGGLMTVFGLAVVGLGAFVIGTFGLGGKAIKAGASAVSVIAQSIVDAAWIFKGADGAFSGGPTKDWVEGVGLAIGAFAPVYKMLTTGGIMELFVGKGPNVDAFVVGIETISKGIVSSAKYLNDPDFNGLWGKGPTKDWAEGVGLAIGAFAPVYKMLTTGGITEFFTGSGPSMETYVAAIETISRGIISSASIFSNSDVGFGDGTYPSVDWAAGVGGALNAFAPVFKGLSGAGWFESGEDVVNTMIYGIKKISYAIVSVGKIFFNSKLEWDNNSVPNKNWNFRVSNAFKTFLNMYKSIKKSEYYFNRKNDVVGGVAKGIVNFASILNRGKDALSASINPNFMKDMSDNVLYYLKLVDKLKESNDSGESFNSFLFGDPISNIASGMTKLAIAYDKMGAAISRFSSAVNSLDEKKLSIFNSINNNFSGKKPSVNNTLGDKLNSVNMIPGSTLSPVSVGKKEAEKEESKFKKQSKYGDNSEQFDKLIDAVLVLTENTKSLEIFLQEKMGQEFSKYSS